MQCALFTQLNCFPHQADSENCPFSSSPIIPCLTPGDRNVECHNGILKTRNTRLREYCITTLLPSHLPASPFKPGSPQ
ncbi:hypothetical protein P154DRAFT_158032 [Amniculicola lignicola CBS 123094]|uniref:Uncharacterized protein n=1 Tax=Amniculicola lignicola CBS 123094 TaxID=1392246 RepID=A0A6A5WRH8_9PLEO|nr:hypothetical protein P154DRAFT_158032 [Amniculicola lignicola CBS 123094]